MQLNSLSISHLRNLHAVDLTFNPHFNIFWGGNGGGKTSLLEAVHLLTLGRSFRTHQSSQLITFGKAACIISGEVSSRNPESLAQGIRLGIERPQSGRIKIRLGEEDCQSIALLAKTLPIQLINSRSYDILEAAPQFRRQFLDWIMFHVEPSFYSVWQRFRKALQQRNAALKETRFLSDTGIQIWDKEFVETGEIIHRYRQAVLTELLPIFSETIDGFLGLQKNEKITVQYQAGWNLNISLQKVVETNLERDKAWGYTTVGPHRADLELLRGKMAVKNVLSRGQSKLFICALLLARAKLLYKRQKRHCVFLIDDLNAELDTEASKLLIEALGTLGAQVLITSIEGLSIAKILEGQTYNLYRVKEGQIG